MLDNKLLDRAERESVLLLHKLAKDNSLLQLDGLNTFSLLSAMFVRGWMAAIIYTDERREKAEKTGSNCRSCTGCNSG